MRVLEAYPFVAEAFSLIREEQNGAFVVCDCPLRNHTSSRLRFWLGTDGRLMFGCYACGREAKREILRTAGLSWKDTFPENTDWKRVKREETAHYSYRDENGVILYQTVRLEPGFRGKDKTFFQRRPKLPGTFPRSRDGWVNGLYLPRRELAVRLVLYKLPELLAADIVRPVFVVAGEKDADSLAQIGFVATTNVCGEAAAWQESYSATLANRNVVVVEDRDREGKRHADEVAGSLLDYAASLRRLRLPAQDSTAFLTELRRRGVRDRVQLRTAFLAELSLTRTWIGAGG